MSTENNSLPNLYDLDTAKTRGGEKFLSSAYEFHKAVCAYLTKEFGEKIIPNSNAKGDLQQRAPTEMRCDWWGAIDTFSDEFRIFLYYDEDGSVCTEFTKGAGTTSRPVWENLNKNEEISNVLRSTNCAPFFTARQFKKLVLPILVETIKMKCSKQEA